MIQFLAYAPGIICTVIFVLMLISSGLGKLENKLFFGITFSVGLWQALLFLTDVSKNPDTAAILLRFAVAFSLFMPYFFALFVQAFVGRFKALYAVLLYIPVLILQLLTFTQFGIPSVTVSGFGAQISNPTIVYNLIVYFTTLTIAGALVYLGVRSRSLGPSQHKQARLIIAGVSASLAINFFGNFFLASTTVGDYAVLATGPSILFFIGSIGVAIFKHRLFNIRLIVARSIGYLLSIVFVAAIYGLITFTLLSKFLFSASAVSGLQQFLYTLLAVIIAFTFPPIKRFFDKTTNRIFYRDAYDPQQLLDGLNKTLVSTIELKSLLYWVSQILSNTLKTEFAIFDIKQANGKTEHVVGSPENAHINKDELAVIQKEAPGIHRKVLLTDDLEEHPRLQKVLRDNNIGLIAHLVDSPKQAQVGLGYLLLGNKKSGNPYSSEDVRIMEIIADELVIAVQNALRFDEIKDFNITLQQKVDDATRKLRHTNEKLKQLDETKDDFISMASHQLRTPLTSVKGYVSMVLEGDAGKITPQQQKLLDQAFVSSQRMVFLIADLLNVSRLKTGKFIIEPKPTNLADIVAGEISQLVETAKGRELTLTYHKPHDFPLMNVDETKTRQVIMNFVDNAIYYTPAGGHITVNLVDKAESVELTVVDDGLGVPKHEQPHLFSKFYRAANAKKARPDGTGLGLFMAKKVIIAQGGALIFKSHEGKGSTFGFSFPKSKLLVK